MSDQNAGSASTQEPVAQPETSNGKVSYETYLKVLGEAKKAKEEKNALLAEKAKVDETKLQENNEWKALANQYKEKLEQTSSRLQEQEKSILNGLKFQEFEKHLGGKLKNRDYVTFAELDKIIVNPESGEVDSESAKNVAGVFLKNHASLIDLQNGVKLPSRAAESFDSKKEKNYKEMTTTEIEAELRKLGKI